MDFVQFIFMAANFEPPDLTRAILNTLTYADIFNYPLTAEQIHRYLPGFSATPQSVTDQSGCLAADGVIARVGDFYMLAGREDIASLRIDRQRSAEQLWPLAINFARTIASLPFVRMVAVTGSLAVDNVNRSGDIDYLIVTVPGRLWLCRLLVLIVVRLASWRGVRLCPNYFLSENAIELSDRNLYTAHEFAQMIPLFGLDIYQGMRTANPWIQYFLPNAGGPPPNAHLATGREPSSALRPLVERVLMTGPGFWLGNWEMTRKIRRLSQENAGNPEAVFNADQCKGHSNRHGQRTQVALMQRLEQLTLEPHE